MALKALKAQEIIQYNCVEDTKKLIRDKTSQLTKRQKKMKMIGGLNTALTGLFVSGCSLAMLFTGISLYNKGLVEFNAILVATVAMMSSFGHVIALSGLAGNLLHTFASGNRVLDILEEIPVVCDVEAGEKAFDICAEQIAAEDVHFAYSQETVLDGVDFTAKKNQIIGIKGESGCGKSTFLKLIMKFWPVSQGKIRIAGKDLCTLNTHLLRTSQAYVTQDTYLFNGTIFENIAIGKQNASQADVEAAAKDAAIHDFIMSLPEGYDTEIGDMGAGLSGGERQRVGLARAFLHDSDMLLLDEPTSNLDSLNEGIVLQSLDRKRADKCLVLVSHRDSTNGICDKVYEMEHGRLKTKS